ncbi:hypothetical protein ACO1KR_13745, partial [Staphylococcus aureus]
FGAEALSVTRLVTMKANELVWHSTRLPTWLEVVVGRVLLEISLGKFLFLLKLIFRERLLYTASFNCPQEIIS